MNADEKTCPTAGENVQPNRVREDQTDLFL